MHIHTHTCFHLVVGFVHSFLLSLFHSLIHSLAHSFVRSLFRFFFRVLLFPFRFILSFCFFFFFFFCSFFSSFSFSHCGSPHQCTWVRAMAHEPTLDDEADVARLVAERKRFEERERQQKVEVKCRYGDEEACVALASMYRFNCSNAAQDLAGPASEEKHAASSSPPPSNATAANNVANPEALTDCSRLANLYLRGVGVKRNTAAAVKLLDFGCRSRHMNSCFSLGVMLNFGFPEEGTAESAATTSDVIPADQRIAIDKDAASDYLTTACMGGHGTACNLVAQNFLNVRPATAASRAAAAAMHHRACELNHMASCANFGLMCLYGVGMRGPHLDLAEKYLTKACDAKHIAACDGLRTLEELRQAATENPAGASELTVVSAD